jgi:thymidylate kinase
MGDIMIKKIGLTGVHGSGKTTKMKELSDRFVDVNKTIHIVDEVARSYPHELGTLEAQEWIWYEQMSREKHAMTQDVDVIICDRTVMDNLMYYHYIIDQDATTDDRRRWGQLYREAVAWMPTYTQVIRLPLNLEWLQADDPIRPKDVEYARRIDALFDRFVQPYVTEESDAFEAEMNMRIKNIDKAINKGTPHKTYLEGEKSGFRYALAIYQELL